MSRIGQAIKQTRQQSGMTAKRLAELTMLSEQYVSDIQLGRRTPSIESMLNIANQFPDQDSAGWLWLLLTDLWGEPIAEAMKQHVLAEADQP